MHQLPKNDREALFGGVSAFGGQFRLGLTEDVTHLVALAPNGVSVFLHQYIDWIYLCERGNS